MTLSMANDATLDLEVGKLQTSSVSGSVLHTHCGLCTTLHMYSFLPRLPPTLKLS